MIAVREVDLDLYPGQVTALMGRNGSGKSSLLWAVQGSGARQAGSVVVAGVDPATLPGQQARRRVGLVPQTSSDLLYLDTVGHDVALGHDDHPVCHGGDELHVVGGHDQAAAGGGQFGDDDREPVLRVVVQAPGRLVEQDHGRRGGELDGQDQREPLAFGQVGRASCRERVSDTV